MPDDQHLDQFPLPSQKEPLTDPVAPDISAPKETVPDTSPTTEYDFPTSSDKDSSPLQERPNHQPPTDISPTSEPDTPPTDSGIDIPPDDQPSPAPEEKPAQPPSSSPKTLFIVIIILLVLAGISTAFFLYTQNSQLKDQVADLNSDLQQQDIVDRATLPEEEEEIATDSSTIEFIIPETESDDTTTTPTPTPLSTSLTQTFSVFTPLFELATASYPDAQLLLISATNLQTDSPVIKYYFRQQPDAVKYFYILNDPNSGLALFDQQIWVSPDDNIPSLNDRAQNDQLGYDLDEVLTYTNSLCQEKHTTCDQTTSIQAKFIDSQTTLWQIVYQLPDTSSPLVYQIDSQTKAIIFRSDQ